jgi:hypothetical protein
MLRALVLALLPALPACGTEPTAALACPAFPGGVTFAASRAMPDAMDETAAAERRAATEIEAVLRAEMARSGPRTMTLEVISLSAGGQYGAFGAGFLSGWSLNAATPRPEFDLVTGVSAGAALAPVAFAGPAFDPLLEFYRGLGRDGVLRVRPLPAWLFAPSLADPAPLETFLDAALNPALLAAIGRGHSEGRRLLVAAANIDTGAGQVFDLGAAAGTANAAPCLREAILASTAIPALLPPRNINGALYADGGLRSQVFFAAIDDARRRVEREAGVDIRVEAYLVVNGALRPPQGPVEDGLLPYAIRSIDILADEVLRDSIEEAVRFAESRGDWRLRGIRAELPGDVCTGAGDAIGGFDACLTAALFEHGLARGRAAPIDWLEAGELRALADEL